MVEIKNAVLTYFVCGATMWGSGLAEWGGAPKLFFEEPGDTAVTGAAGENVEGAGSALDSIIGVVNGPLNVAWDLVTGFTEIFAWPMATLYHHNTPPEVTVLLGGTVTAGMVLAVVSMFINSS